jgi:hypothetical protein
MPHPLQVQREQRFIPKHNIEKGPPSCHKCHEPMKLLRETTSHWEFGCERCQHAHVFTKPQSQAAAQYHVQQGRREQAQRMKKAYESRTKYFLGGSR